MHVGEQSAEAFRPVLHAVGSGRGDRIRQLDAVTAADAIGAGDPVVR